MRYCPNCGAQCPDGTTFCTNCGASLQGGPQPGTNNTQNNSWNAGQNQNAWNNNPNQNAWNNPNQNGTGYNYPNPGITPRSIPVCVILSIITCGIYGIYWMTSGMSDVYKAKDHVLGRFVAIKVLKPEFSEDRGFVAKFRTEAQSAAGLEHPNIVNIFDVGSEEGILHYIVMEDWWRE